MLPEELDLLTMLIPHAGLQHYVSVLYSLAAVSLKRYHGIFLTMSANSISCAGAWANLDGIAGQRLAGSEVNLDVKPFPHNPIFSTQRSCLAPPSNTLVV